MPLWLPWTVTVSIKKKKQAPLSEARLLKWGAAPAKKWLDGSARIYKGAVGAIQFPARLSFPQADGKQEKICTH